MSDQKYVPANVFLKCDKGVTPCQLKILRPGPDLYDEKWAVEGDALPIVNVSTFGVCAITHGPCVPATVRWQNTLMGALQVDAGGIPQNPLLDNSFLPCTIGGKIDIFFTRAAVTQAMQAEEDAKQVAAAKEVSEKAKTTSMLLFGAAILVAAVVVVATGGAALPLILGAAAAGAAVGGGVGAVAGGIEGYAHGGTMGAVKGAAVGLVGGAVMGAVGGAAAVAGGPVAVGLLEASVASFGVATAADAFTFYKQPTQENGLVLLADIVILFGAKAVENQARGAKELEATTGPEPQRCASGKEPIDFASGAMFFASVDIELPGPVPFVWERTFYSNSKRHGPLGYGWHHSYDQALWPDPAAGTVAMRLGDGRLAIFDAPNAENAYCGYYRARQLELRPAPDGSNGYVVYSVREQCTYHFIPAPAVAGQYHLLAVEDGYGHVLRFTYSEHGHLAGIVDSAGREIEVRTDTAGRILALELPRPDGAPGIFAAVQYGYDEQGHMTSVTNAEGHTRHFRYEEHRMVQKTFATGISFYYEYDALGRCTRTWGDENYYNGRMMYEPHCTTVYTDDPQAVDVYYHEQGLATTHINALGHAYHWRYNQHLELEEEQDALGNTTRYSYDGRGNRTSVTYPDGATVQTQYNQHDQPAQATDANGHPWQWQYDERGELIARIDPTGASVRYRYDDQGQLIEIRDALNYPTRLRYDAHFNLVHIVSPDNNIRSRTYDALGRLVGLTDAMGSQQRRRYNLLNQLVEVQEADGQSIQLTYDGEGNVVRARNGNQEVTFAYTAVNRLAVRRQAGQEVQFAYDREARLVGLTNEHGRHYRFALDAAGRVVEEEGFDGLLRQYMRDAAGRVTTVQRPAGRTTAYTYNVAGQLAAVSHNDEAPITYRYSPAGALIEVNNTVTTVRLEHDALGRVMREHQGLHTVEYAYDPRSQRTSLRSSLGAAFDWQHDAMGNLSTVQAGERWQAQLVHDARGLELQRQLSSGLRLDWGRDAAGRPTSQRVAGGPQPARQRRYHWQGADQLTQIEDSLTGTTRYSYDASGTLTGATYANGDEDVRLPDAVGNLFRSPALDDRQYAPGGQLRQANGTRYRYDAEGNLTRKTSPTGQAWHYAWDGAGQLTSVSLPNGYVVQFSYDGLGRRLSKRYRGRVTRWVWDGNVPLHEWHELEVGPEAGSPAQLATWLFDENGSTPAAKLTAHGTYSVVADHLGTPLTLYDEQGTRRWDMQLDSYGAVRHGQGQAQDCPFRYQGQYEDAETGLYYNRFRYYDPESGSYISQDPIGLWGGLNVHAYVHDTSSWVDPMGLSPVQANPFDIVNYSAKTSPLENHHGILDVWATHNVPDYKSRAGHNPTIALEQDQHAATKSVYRDWLEARTGKRVGGKVDWKTVPESEVRALSERMFDAASVPQHARDAYYKRFNDYVATGCGK